MRHWAWLDAPTEVRGACAGCGEPLWKNRDGGLITYASRKWHVHCALDKLPSPDIGDYYGPG